MCFDLKCLFLTTDQKLETLITHKVIKGIITQKSCFSLFKHVYLCWTAVETCPKI